MHWNNTHTYLLKKRKDVIGMLPNVKPKKAKWFLDEIQQHFQNQQIYSLYTDRSTTDPYEIKGISITESDYKLMIISDEGYRGEVDYITPEGAEIIIRMYRNGCFELNKKGNGLGSTQELEAYAASKEELLKRHAARIECENLEKVQILHWKEHPEELPVAKFTASLLDEIMWYHKVIGMQVSMQIGGVTVTKEVSRYKSNSGKTDNEVVFKWMASDGTLRKETLRHSSYQNNRRNDEDRNWGLK